MRSPTFLIQRRLNPSNCDSSTTSPTPPAFPPRDFQPHPLRCPLQKPKDLRLGASDASQSQVSASRKSVRNASIINIGTKLLFIVAQNQERDENKEKAKEKTKEKALATTRANLINHKGDELMYKPSQSYAAPTLTGGK